MEKKELQTGINNSDPQMSIVWKTLDSNSYGDTLTTTIKYQSIFENIETIKEALALAIIENGSSSELCTALLKEVKPLTSAIVERCLESYPELYTYISNYNNSDEISKLIIRARNIVMIENI